MSILLSLIQLVSGVALLFCLVAGVKGLIFGTVKLLDEDAEGGSVRIASGIMLATFTVVAAVMSRFKASEFSDPSLASLLANLAPGLVAAGGIWGAYAYIQSEEGTSWFGSGSGFGGDDSDLAAAGTEGARSCSRCGKPFCVSLALGASGLVRVASCRACPADTVFAICERCADLEEVRTQPCPRCGAQHLWDEASMQP